MSRRHAITIRSALLSGMMAIAIACTNKLRGPSVDAPEPEHALDSSPLEPVVASETAEPVEPEAAPASPPSPPSVTQLSGLLGELDRDAQEVCTATIVGKDEQPIVAQADAWLCARTAELAGYYVGQRVVPTLGPCGDDPACPSPDAIVITDFHVRGKLSNFIVDAAGACFVGLFTVDGSTYFPAADELCWSEDEFASGGLYETLSGPCGENLGCPYYSSDVIVVGLRRFERVDSP